MSKTAIDFQAISASTNFLTGPRALNAMQVTQVISAHTVNKLVRAHHPAIKRDLAPKVALVKHS
jgi:hypothetical protein